MYIYVYICLFTYTYIHIYSPVPIWRAVHLCRGMPKPTREMGSQWESCLLDSLALGLACPGNLCRRAIRATIRHPPSDKDQQLNMGCRDKDKDTTGTRTITLHLTHTRRICTRGHAHRNKYTQPQLFTILRIEVSTVGGESLRRGGGTLILANNHFACYLPPRYLWDNSPWG